MRDPKELLHAASNQVLVMGVVIEKMRKDHPDEATLVEAAKAYDGVLHTLKELNLMVYGGRVVDNSS